MIKYVQLQQLRLENEPYYGVSFMLRIAEFLQLQTR